MTADAERSLAKENGRAVFAVFDDQRLRAHGEHFVRGARQVGFVGQHFRFGVVDEKDVDEFQGFAEFLERALDPVIHGVAAGQAHAVHLAAHVGLQGGLDVGQEKELGVFVFLRNARLEALENVQIGEIRFGFVEVFAVGSSPAEGLALGALDASNVDSTLEENLFLLGAEVFAHHGHDAHLGEIACGQRKVGCGSGQNFLHAARGRGDVIECN